MDHCRSPVRVPRAARLALTAATLSAVLVAAGSAAGGHLDGYEAAEYEASPDGTPLEGQPAGADNPYYVPVEGSDQALLFTYQDNAIGLPANPTGGANFVASIGGDPDNDPEPFSRAQRDVVFLGGTIKIAYDILVTKLGDPRTTNFVGSFSTRVEDGGAAHIDIAAWVDTNDATRGWIARVVWADAEGSTDNEQIPEFTDLPIGRWYRRTSTVDLTTGEFLQLTLTDLETGEQRVHDPAGRYLIGGKGAETVPIGFRYYAGCRVGNCTAGNTIAWDNLAVTCGADLDEDGDVDFEDLLALLAAWGPCPGGCLEDLTRDENVGFADLLALLAAWGSCDAP